MCPGWRVNLCYLVKLPFYLVNPRCCLGGSDDGIVGLFGPIPCTTFLLVQLQISCALSPSMLFPKPPVQLTNFPHVTRCATSSESNASTWAMLVNISIAYLENELKRKKYDSRRFWLILFLSPSPSAHVSVNCIRKTAGSMTLSP